MKKPAKRCGLSLLLFLFVSPLFAFNQYEPFDVEADTITYRNANQEIIAEGHVRVYQSSASVVADYLLYNRVEGKMRAKGNVVLRDKKSILNGSEMEYDLALEKGQMLGGRGYGAPWLFQGAAWEKEGDLLVGRNTAFTSCNLPDPHYHFLSDRISLIEDHLFWGWGNSLHLNTTPIFYSPFLHKSLEPKRVAIQTTPGSDSVKGAFAKTKTTIRITPHVYDRVLYDYYTKSGSGVGNEFFYENPNLMKGSLFGYYINPKGTPELVGAPSEPQYSVRFYHWQQISPTLTFQSNTNMRKNVSFNNQFFPQDYNQSVNDILNSMALTHQTKRVNQRIVVEATNGPDANDDPLFADTHIQSASLPRYDVTLYQVPLWTPKISTQTLSSTQRLGPLQLSANGNAGRTYTRTDRTTRTNATGGATVSQNINLGRRWSLTPSLTPSLLWQDQATSTAGAGAFRGFQGRMGTSDLLRYRPLSAVTIDQTYNWTGRLEPNEAGLDDEETNDHGIETHNLTWLLYWRPNRVVQLRSSSGYDLRQLENESLDAYRQRRIMQWFSELTVYPSRSNWEYYLRYTLGYYPTRTIQWEASTRTRLRYNTFIETGLLYNRGIPGLITWNNRLGIYVTPAWRVDTVLNAYLPNGSGRPESVAKMLQSEFVVTRNLHCWEIQFRYINRQPFSREYALRANLRFGTEAEKDLADANLESQFYPWRYRN